MRKKILFFGWENHESETLQNEIQKVLGKEFEIIFAQYDTIALDEIAKAKHLKHNPICAIVFKRNTLVANSNACKIITKFAEHYVEKKYLVPINLIYSDQDTEARFCSVGANFANQGNWSHVATILKNNT